MFVVFVVVMTMMTRVIHMEAMWSLDEDMGNLSLLMIKPKVYCSWYCSWC